MGSCASVPTDDSNDRTNSTSSRDAGDTESPMAHSAATQNGPPGDRSNFRQKNGDGSPMAGTGSDGRRFDERSLPEGLVGHLAGLAGKAVPGRMGSSQQEQRREEQRRTLLTEHGEFLISLVAILEYQVSSSPPPIPHPQTPASLACVAPAPRGAGR